MAWAINGTPETKSGAGTGLAITDLTACKFNVFLIHQLSSTNVSPEYRLDSNSNTDYAYRKSSNGGTDGTVTSDNNAQIDSSGGNNDKFAVMFSCNIDSEEKLAISFVVNRNTAGASTAPTRTEGVSKVDTSTNTGQYTSIDSETGGYAIGIGSNISALGSDLTPASATSIETGSIYIDTDIAGRYFYDGTNWTMQPTFQDDYSSNSNWTTYGSGITVNSNNVNWSSVSGGTNGIYRDFGSNLSSNWVLHFEFTTVSGTYNWIPINIQSGTGHYSTGSQNTLGLNHASTESGIKLLHITGGTPTVSSGQVALSANTLYYVTLTKSGSTITAEFFTNSDRTSSTGSISMTISGTAGDSLRYIHHSIHTSVSQSITTSGDNLKIYDGVTSIN